MTIDNKIETLTAEEIEFLSQYKTLVESSIKVTRILDELDHYNCPNSTQFFGLMILHKLGKINDRIAKLEATDVNRPK